MLGAVRFRGGPPRARLIFSIIIDRHVIDCWAVSITWRRSAVSGFDFGYMRVSTDDQDLSLQRNALLAKGIPESRIYSDQMSGATMERPGLNSVYRAMRPGDTLYVWRLDRLGRSVFELETLTRTYRDEGITLKSLTEPFDTSSALGIMMFQMLAVFAEFERNLIRERTMAGLAAAKARGSKAGPKPKMTPDQVIEAERRLLEGIESTADVAASYGVSKPTLYRYIPGGREGLEQRRAAMCWNAEGAVQ